MFGKSFWKRQRVVVTGGAGFLGRNVVHKLLERRCEQIVVPRSKEYDLREKDEIRRLYRNAEPSMVIHLAAVTGGIAANLKEPGRFFYDNAIMGIQLMEWARRTGVERFVAVGTVCAYPKWTPVPFRENDLWAGYPEETNAPYGLAKKILLVQSQAYRAQYDFNSIYLLPVNMYGPGDNFDLESSHVIPALIRKFVEGRENGTGEIVLWGDGSVTREFLYVEDAAEGILMAAEKYNKGAPVNIGNGKEITVRALAERVRKLTRYEGELIWDTSKPNGQPRRCLDITRAKQEFGFCAFVELEDGLQRTIEWYEDARQKRSSKETVTFATAT